MKQIRHIDKEAAMGRAAAKKHVKDTEVINLPAIKRACFAAGYTQAILDVAEGKVHPPIPDWRLS